MKFIWDLYNIREIKISISNIEKWDTIGVKIEDFLNKTKKIQGKIMNDISDYLILNKDKMKWGTISILLKYNLTDKIINKIGSDLDVDVLFFLKKNNSVIYNQKIEILGISSTNKFNNSMDLYSKSVDFFDISDLEEIYNCVDDEGVSLIQIINSVKLNELIVKKYIDKFLENNIVNYSYKGIRKIPSGVTDKLDILDLINKTLNKNSTTYKCVANILKEYNFSKLSNKLNIHRGLIIKKCEILFEYKIVNEHTRHYYNMITEYDIPSVIFCEIFKINIETYNYFKYFYDKNSEKFVQYSPLDFYHKLSVNQREEFLKISNSFFENGEIWKRNFNDISNLFLLKNKEKIFHIEKLEDELINFAKTKNYEIIKGRNTIAKLERNENLIFSFKKQTRFYDYSIINKNVLIDIRNILLANKGLYSSKYFYDNYLFFKRDLNLKNHYELHNLLKKILSNNEDNNLIFRRMPNILIGFKTDKEFYKELIVEFSEIDENDFYIFLSLEYGHDINTLRGNLPILLNEFYLNNKYVVEFTSLTNNQINNILDKINEEYSSEEIILVDKMKEIFKDLKIPWELFNNQNAIKLGFRRQKSYVFKKNYSNLSQVFMSQIEKNGYFEKNSFEQIINDATIDNWLKKGKIFRFTKNKYITRKKLFSGKFTENLFNELINDLNDIHQQLNERFYTINIFKNHLNDQWNNFGFEDEFYESLLEYQLKWKVIRTTIKIFYKGENILTISNFIEYLVNQFESISNRDLNTFLKNKYLIYIDDNKLDIWLNNCDRIYYKNSLKKSFMNIDKYYDEFEKFDESKV